MVQSIDTTSNISSSMTYDTYGNLITTTDASGNTTSFGYDSLFHTYTHTKTSPILGVTEQYVYEWNWTEAGASGVVKITSTDVNGQDTVTYYDTFNRLWKVIKPGYGDSFTSPSIEYQYNNWGIPNLQNITTVTKADETNTLWQRQFFDGLGRVIQVQTNGEAGHTIISNTTVFNNRGLSDKQYVSQDIPSALNAYQPPETSWKYSTSAYDALGRVVSQTGVDGTTVTHDYSTVWSDNVTNPLGHKTSYAYDAFNRLTQVIEYDSDNETYAITHYTYDALGNLKQVTDNDGNNTTMTYNWLSQKTIMDGPDMGYWAYGYDANGNLHQQTDARGKTIVMGYDALNRLVSKTYPVDSGMANVTYEYDSRVIGDYGNGQRTSMVDASGVTYYAYDERGRLHEEKRTIDSANYTTTYYYDGADRSTWIMYPSGEAVQQAYDGRGLPNYLSGSKAGTIVSNAAYNQLGGMTKINLGNGIETTYSYWGLDHGGDTQQYGKLWEIKTTKPESVTGNVLTVNGGGKVIIPGEGTFTDYETGESANITAVPDPGYKFVCWTSNNVTALEAVIGNRYDASTTIAMNGSFSIAAIFAPVAGGGALQQVQYSWDANGNLLTRFDGITDETETFTYDSLDRLLTASSIQYTEVYTYNTIGNIMSRTYNGLTTGYQYNNLSHVHAVTDVGSKTYAYDANGNMWRRGTQILDWDVENRLVSVDDSGNVTTFVYDGDGARVKKIEGGQTIVYVNQYYEVNLTTTNATSSYYLGGKLVATSENGTLRYVHQDHLTSTSLMTDEAGNQIGDTVKYLPFGETRANPDIATDKLFTGQRLDSTGLYYYNARYYDPTIGRFISPDTVIPNPANPQSFNRYSYCRNNPTSRIDPSGHDDLMVYNALMAWSRSQAEAKKAVIEAASKMPNGGGLFLLDALTALDQTTVPDYILNILEKPASKPIDLGMLPFENSEWFIGSSSGAGSIWLKWKLDPNIKFTDTAIIDRTMKGGGRILSVEGPHQGASGWHFNSDVKPFSYLDHAPTPVIGPGLKYVAKGFVWAGLAVDAGDLYTSFQADGWSFGPNAQHAVGRVGGGWGGAAAGAIIGSAFGPTGTLIGGILGGIFGSWAGGSLVN